MWVSHALDNIRSCRVIEKNHFHYMGTMQRTLRSLQETRTSKVYRLTKKEYEAKRN